MRSQIGIDQKEHAEIDGDVDDADQREADSFAQHIEMRLDQCGGAREISPEAINRKLRSRNHEPRLARLGGAAEPGLAGRPGDTTLDNPWVMMAYRDKTARPRRRKRDGA